MVVAETHTVNLAVNDGLPNNSIDGLGYLSPSYPLVNFHPEYAGIQGQFSTGVNKQICLFAMSSARVTTQIPIARRLS